MKVSSFYLNDISNYEDIVEYITDTIYHRFYGIGKNSIALTKLITFIKSSIKTYIRLKYQKQLKVIVTFPKSETRMVYQDDKADSNLVRIRLNYDIVSSILLGQYDDIRDYINDLFEQLETEITDDNKFSFSEYLMVQIDSMVEIAKMELKASFSLDYLKEHIIKKDSWIKLSQESSVFKDYYTAYMNSASNKRLFFTFLKKLAQTLIQ